MLLWFPNYDVRKSPTHIVVGLAHNLRTRENIHSEMYAALISTLITDSVEQYNLFNAIETIPCVRAKAEWTLRWIDGCSTTFALRLVAFAAVEGIFFSSSFASIFWLKGKGIMHGLCFSNELISRDEGMHMEFACLVFQTLKRRPSQEEVLGVVLSAVELEKAFVKGKAAVSFSCWSLRPNR